MTPVTVLISRILMSLRDVRVPGRDQEFFHALVADSTENPDPVPVGSLLEGARPADNFDAISARGQIAESGFGDHIRCFFFQVHHRDHVLQ